MDRDFNNLDELSNALEERQGLRPIRRGKERQRSTDANLRKRVGNRQSRGERFERKAPRPRPGSDGIAILSEPGILAIPAVIVVLIVSILILDRGNASPNGDIYRATESSVESSGETGSTEETQDPKIVAASNDSSLNQFFTDYFAAKLQVDVNKLAEMSDVDLSTEQKQNLSVQLKVQSGYIEGYNNLKVYAANGLKEGEKIAFVSYDVKFRRADTPAPSILYAYMKRGTDGSYKLTENLTPEEAQYVNDYTTNHQEVKDLVNGINTSLLSAVSNDSRLAVFYDAFQTGRIYREDQSKIDSEVNLISVQTEAETSFSTESGGQSGKKSSGKNKSSEGIKSKETKKSSGGDQKDAINAGDPGESSKAETKSTQKEATKAGTDTGEGAPTAAETKAAESSAAPAGSGAGADVIEIDRNPGA